jgi:hypothetical protein
MKITLQLLRNLIVIMSVRFEVRGSRLMARTFTLCLLTFGLHLPAWGQQTAFTYQGHLTENGQPANGTYELRMAIYNQQTAGSPIAGPLDLSPVTVSNGLFTATVDFGSAAPALFNGSPKWLEIGARTNESGGFFITLSPRQQITATPYAITAGSFTGTLPGAQLSGTYPNAVAFTNSANLFGGSGGGLTGVNATLLDGLDSVAFWQTGGNGGTGNAHFLGTTDNQPLELKVNDALALRLEPAAAPNVIGGGSNSTVAPGRIGAAIGGGAAHSADADYASIGGGLTNRAGGGPSPTVAGGQGNTAGGHWTTVGGGLNNTVIGYTSAIGGGGGNNIETNADHSTVSGGLNNRIQQLSFRGVIGGGEQNRIQTNAFASTIGGGLLNVIQANAGVATVSGGSRNVIREDATYATVGGGEFNGIGSFYGTIGGGGNNSIGTNSNSGTISGGFGHSIGNNSFDGAIGGGSFASIGTQSDYVTIGGGRVNSVGNSAASSTIAGGFFNSIGTNSPESVIGGGSLNAIQANAQRATICGGFQNVISNTAVYATIVGGSAHANSGDGAFIGGGFQNAVRAFAYNAFVGGGAFNTVESGAVGATVGGGYGNAAGGAYGTVSGGLDNTNTGSYGMIPGGHQNSAAGQFSLAAGRRAKANHTGAFVWGDSTNADVASTNANSVTLRAAGGYRLFSNSATTAGVFLGAGGTSWAAISDRDVKKDFAAVDSRAILEKLATMPITLWRYQWEGEDATPHLGPMAQDFKAAFYPGRDDKSITTQEADGVALAAIQGLNAKLAEREASLREELKLRDAENAELKQMIFELKELVQTMNHKLNAGAK